MPSARSLPLPSSIGPFRLIARVGQGGFAPVFRAEEVYEGRKLRDVAIKLFSLPDDIPASSPEAARWRDGVIDEAHALCRVEHPNVVRFHTLKLDDARGLVALVMEYVPGKNLGALLHAEGPLPERRVLDAGISVAWALAAVHNAGLVHRDVKPENIIEAPSGHKLIDFGIVVDTGPRASNDGDPPRAPRLVGTPGYVAPEYLTRGALPSPAGDLYALGVTLSVLASGRLPPEMPTAPQDPAGRRPAPEPMPASLAELVTRLVEPDPGARPRHADWVARMLEHLRDGLAAPASRGRAIDPGPGERREVSPSDEGIRRTRMDAATIGDTAPELSHSPPFLGRADALATIARAARAAAQGSLQFVRLTGPLGIGRSRLLQAAVAQSGVPAERVLQSHGSPERRGPLRPLLAALRALPDRGAAFRLLEEAIGQALTPAALPSAPQGDEALEAVEDALLLAAAEAPVVLAIDDVQWADEPTLRLLTLLVERASCGARTKLLVLAAARDEPSARAPLRALRSAVRAEVRSGVHDVALGPLTPAEAAALAQATGPLAPDLERAVVRGSGGVPFFLVNALFAWRETGAIVFRKDAFHAAREDLLAEGIPGVAALLEARLAACFAASRPLLRAALRALAAVALHGGGLPMETLLGAAGPDEGMDDVLEALVDAGLLVAAGEPPEYSFAQEMVRLSLLNLVRQKPWFYRLHRALLDAIARGPGAAADAAFLATGYEKLGDHAEARRWLGQAMESAVLSGLTGEAVRFGDRLAALAPDSITRADAEIAVTRALVLGRQFEAAAERLARPTRDAAPSDPARATVQALRWRILRLQVARGRSEAAEDPALLGDADAIADAQIPCEARIALAGVAPEAQAMQLAGEAIALAARAGPALEFAARVLRVELIYAASRRDLPQAERDLQRALTIARASGSIWRPIHIEGDLAVLEAELGRADEAILRLGKLAAQADARGMRGQLRTLLHNLATCLMRVGRAGEAAEVARRTADLAVEAGDPTVHGIALSLQAYALFCTGALEEALAAANEAEWLQHERDDRMRAQTLLRRAAILEAMGREAEALDDARAAQEAAAWHGEQGFLVTATLWEELHRARLGEATAASVEEALAAVEAAGVGQRALTRRLVEKANAWLASATAPASC